VVSGGTTEDVPCLHLAHDAQAPFRLSSPRDGNGENYLSLPTSSAKLCSTSGAPHRGSFATAPIPYYVALGHHWGACCCCLTLTLGLYIYSLIYLYLYTVHKYVCFVLCRSSGLIWLLLLGLP
jgi:hypothetical protein